MCAFRIFICGRVVIKRAAASSGTGVVIWIACVDVIHNLDAFAIGRGAAANSEEEN